MADEEQEKAPDKLDQQMGKARVLTQDISYLMTRARDGALVSIIEYVEVQEEIHDLQRILADWESYLSAHIAEKAAQHAVNGIGAKIRMHSGARFEH